MFKAILSHGCGMVFYFSVICVAYLVQLILFPSLSSLTVYGLSLAYCGVGWDTMENRTKQMPTLVGIYVCESFCPQDVIYQFIQHFLSVHNL